MFYQWLRKIAQGFGWLKDFLTERNNSVYFRRKAAHAHPWASRHLDVLSGIILQAIKD
jgi:hypothetical protein